MFRKSHRLNLNETWLIGGNNIEVVNNMKYLGLNWSYNHAWALHRKKTLIKCNQALFALSKFFYMNRNLPVSSFIGLFKAIIQPIILYASEIWCLSFSSRGSIVVSESLNWLKDLDKPANRFLQAGSWYSRICTQCSSADGFRNKQNACSCNRESDRVF